jgi:hypothetical protein
MHKVSETCRGAWLDIGEGACRRRCSRVTTTQGILLAQKSNEEVAMSCEPDLSHRTQLLIGPSTSWDLSGATACPGI